MILQLFESPIFERAFRPFFFLGALYSIFSIGIWAAFYGGTLTFPSVFLAPLSWHAHEMIYGFTMAIVSGFLLTAVANWTGLAPVRQIHLAGLCILWLAGRVVMGVELGLPLWAIMLIELSFIPAITISLAIPLFGSWNKRNLIFLTFLSVLFICDYWFLRTSNMIALHVALMIILIMISLVAGRIIPAFTVAGLRRKGIKAFQTKQNKMDIAALVSLVTVCLCLFFSQINLFLTICTAVSALIHGLRMRHYKSFEIMNDPLLLILHIGYLWLVLGLIILSLVGLDVYDISMALHAFTAGCVGTMVFGMICRVTLGHTGRELKVSPLISGAFLMIQFMALIRIFGPSFYPELTMIWIVSSAALWSICFASYLFVYTPILFAPKHIRS